MSHVPSVITAIGISPHKMYLTVSALNWILLYRGAGVKTGGQRFTLQPSVGFLKECVGQSINVTVTSRYKNVKNAYNTVSLGFLYPLLEGQ